jgi:hypothetical protein
MNKLLKITCQSVPGGWRTCVNESVLIGPTFNSVNELWKWQKINIDTLKQK